MARKILLADDSVTAQNMGRRILTDAGYEVITVNNGSAAMKKVAEIKPDLIVLDVYMPGYGGLEICQRIRETPELARIPVLLTVGKLEPFKADDAKRVRADAFIIKPFEVSELLTALTKLEDKIVPSGQPFAGSAGRFARAVASIEEAKSGKEFGDTDTGWKSRLKIPAPYSKPHETHVDPPVEEPAKKPEVAAKSAEKEIDRVASIVPPSIASALPHDVTPEEIEAITAAAALLAGHTEAANASEPIPEAAKEETPAALAEERTRISAMLEDGTSEAATLIANLPPAEEDRSQASSSSEPQEAQKLVVDKDEHREDDFAAALASLSPMSQKDASADIEEPVITMAGVTYSGPRWIAEESPVTDDEATLVLELEMERAYAAFAAADAARMFLGDSRYSGFGSAGGEEESAPENVGEIEAPAVETAIAQQDLPTAEAAPISETSTEVAEPPQEIKAEEVSAPEPEAALKEPEHALVEAVAEAAPVAEAEAKAAYAVAGAGSSAVSSSEVVAPTDVSSPAETEPKVNAQESELAAAWANWKQVRETVAAPQGSSGVEASAGFREFRSEPAQTESGSEKETFDETASDAAEEASEVASIVDSVLADLKPKLMKEIAQKMGKGKKKKKRD